MKHHLLCFLLLFIISLSSAQTWEKISGDHERTYIGAALDIDLDALDKPHILSQSSIASFTDMDNWSNAYRFKISANAKNQKFVISNQDTAFVAYNDASGKLICKPAFEQYNGDSILSLSSEVFSLVCGSDHQPVVLFTDKNTGAVSARKFSSGKWKPLGQSGFLYGACKASVNKSNQLVATSTDGTRLYIKLFDGSDWISLSDEFAGMYIQGREHGIEILDNGIIYLSYYQEISMTDYSIKFLRWEGTQWVEQTSPVTMPFKSPGTKMYKDGETLYFTYVKYSPSYVASNKLVKLEKGNWTELPYPMLTKNFNSSDRQFFKFGKTGAYSCTWLDTWKTGIIRKLENNRWRILNPENVNTEGGSVGASVALDSKNNPYVIYLDPLKDMKASVKTFINGKWTYVGAPDFSRSSIRSVSVTMNEQDTLYASFIYDTPDFYDSLYVFKYDGLAWISVASKGGFQPSNVIASSKCSPLGDLMINTTLFGNYEDIYILRGRAFLRNYSWSAPSMDFTFDARNNLLVAYSLGTDYIPTLETFSSTDYTRLSKITLTTKTAYVSPICFSNNKLYLSMYHLNGSYTEIYKWENQVLTPISNPLAPTLKAKGEYLTVNPSDQPVVYFDFGYAEIRRSGYTGTDWEITKEALAPTLYAKSSAVIGRNDVLLYTSSAFNTSIQIRVPHVITALQGKAEQPVTDKVRFLNNSFFFSEAAEVEVFDLTGKKVVSAVGIEVSLRLLPPQLYVYRAVLHSENFSGKVVVVKE